MIPPPPRSTLFPYTTLFRSTLYLSIKLVLFFSVPSLAFIPVQSPQDFRKSRQISAGDHLDRKSTRLNSSHVRISYAVFCLKKKKKKLYTYPLYPHYSIRLNV